MSQDEARFGRINDPKRCWAASHCRPVVKKQIVREYIYAYGAVSPKDGKADFLILPAMDTVCMNLFLAEIGARHKDEFLLLIYDGASCHSPGALNIPDNMIVETLPPYSPELNPVENWGGPNSLDNFNVQISSEKFKVFGKSLRNTFLKKGFSNLFRSFHAVNCNLT